MVTVKLNEAGFRQLEEDVAYGLLNYGLRLEGALKGQAVVMGGHRSRNTVPTKAGTPRVGGTLRRSMHAVVYLNGQQLARRSLPGEPPPPNYPTRARIQLYAGTNSGYGLYVDQGTSRMAARPMLIPAFLETKDQLEADMAAGVRRHRKNTGRAAS